jgi:peroxiredoxin|tara:strand:- start:1267 stop:1800 length:534 start_codon:yes stop_codon:yes gene_type:complete
MMIEGFVIPKVTFRTRVYDDTKMEYTWQDTTTDDYLKGKRVVLFSLPGAFTPTCSTYQLPGFEENYDAIRNQDIDEVYCISVNDAFVMNAWGKDQNIQHVKMIPDGSGNFTRYMGMLIGKNHLGFGMRSWRYMAIIRDGVIEKWWQEPGINNDGSDDDPYIETTPENCISYLRTKLS